MGDHRGDASHIESATALQVLSGTLAGLRAALRRGALPQWFWLPGWEVPLQAGLEGARSRSCPHAGTAGPGGPDRRIERGTSLPPGCSTGAPVPELDLHRNAWFEVARRPPASADTSR